MTDQLISFETSKLLKQHTPTEFKIIKYWYNSDGRLICSLYENLSYQYPALTQSLLQKWFREVHKIHIEILINPTQFTYSIYNFKQKRWNHIYQPNRWFSIYEEALEEALKQAFNYI